MRNGSPTDHFHWEGAGGLYRTDRTGPVHADADRTGRTRRTNDLPRKRGLPATGPGERLYRLSYLRGDTHSSMCPFSGTSIPVPSDAELANPLTGNHEQELPVFDRNGDGKLEHGEHLRHRHAVGQGAADVQMSVSAEPGTRIPHEWRTEDRHVYQSFEHQHAHPDQSRTTAMYSRSEGPNVRAAYLNGISDGTARHGRQRRRAPSAVSIERHTYDQ